jgi:hypothetical protein
VKLGGEWRMERGGVSDWRLSGAVLFLWGWGVWERERVINQCLKKRT